MPAITKDRVITAKRKMGKDTQDEICALNQIDQKELDGLLTYKAIVPSVDTKVQNKIEESVLEALEMIEPVLESQGVVSAENMPAFRSKVIDSVQSAFLNASIYSEFHLEQLVKSGQLELPASDSSVSDEVADVLDI